MIFTMFEQQWLTDREVCALDCRLGGPGFEPCRSVGNGRGREDVILKSEGASAACKIK